MVDALHHRGVVRDEKTGEAAFRLQVPHRVQHRDVNRRRGPRPPHALRSAVARVPACARCTAAGTGRRSMQAERASPCRQTGQVADRLGATAANGPACLCRLSQGDPLRRWRRTASAPATRGMPSRQPVEAALLQLCPGAMWHLMLATATAATSNDQRASVHCPQAPDPPRGRTVDAGGKLGVTAAAGTPLGAQDRAWSRRGREPRTEILPAPTVSRPGMAGSGRTGAVVCRQVGGAAVRRAIPCTSM